MYNSLNYSSANFQPLALETLRRTVPSIYTEDNADQTSKKYQHISTEKVVDGLIGEGFLPVYATQCRSRNIENRPYTKHMLRFRHINTRPTIDGLFPEIVLINSHDGLSSYRLMAGIYRLVCSNGLVAGHSFDEIRVRHQGDIMGNVIEGTYEVIENSQKMIQKAEEMQSIELNSTEKLVFAEAVHTIRFEENPLGEAFKPESFLRARRYQDTQKSDLFTVFNIAQENVMKGGVQGFTRNERGYHKRTSTRAIKSIDQSTLLNKALWSLAEKMIELKNT